jgi:cobalt-zinc-cadmium efflux system membrane fusion protein
VRRLLFVLLLPLLFGCPKDKDDTGSRAREEPKAAASAPHEEHDTIPKRVKLPAAVVAGANVKTAPATREILAPTLSLPGEIAADPDKSARVSSPVAGRIVDVRFREGSTVKKGDLLAIVRIPEIGKVRAAHSANLAKAASARANAERLEALADKGLSPKQEAVAARAEADALDAETKALGEQLSALGMGEKGSGSELALRAPVSGTVVAREAVVGQPIGTEQTIASIADLAEVWFLARVFEKDLGRLETGASSEVTLNAYPNERFDGKVEYVGKQIDPIARTVTARIRLSNRDDQLRIGLFGAARVVAKGEADTNKREPVLAVPRSAITDVAGKTVVFVRVGDDEFETHEVTVGDGSAGKVRILSGLREGEPVVVEGAFTVKSVLLRGTIAGAEE